MSKTTKILLVIMTVVILALGCALCAVITTLGDTAVIPTAEYEAPALNEVEEVVEEVIKEVAEPAAVHPLGWSAQEEIEAVAYADKTMALLDEWLALLDVTMGYNDQMVADPNVIFDIGWTTGYWFALSDWINLADECLAWPVPFAPLNEVDRLMKRSCSSWKLSAKTLQTGLDGLPGDIDGLIYNLGLATDELDEANQYMGQATTRLDEITSQLGY